MWLTMKNKWLLMPVFIAGIILSFTAAMLFAVENYTVVQVSSSGFISEAAESVSQILYEIRLPRVMAAFLAGLMISIAGLIMQTVTHNDLSEPSILGINAGSNFFIVIGALLIPTLSFVGMVIGGFIGG